MKLHEAPSPNFSIADITLGVALDFAEMVKLDLPFDLPFDLRNVARYRKTLQGRGSFQNA